jgi:hypothetical protein
MRHLTLLVVCWLAGAVASSGQVLLTGETGGSGTQAVAGAANLISPRDFGKLANFWAQYGYGLTDRIDLFAAYGNTTVFSETQHYVGGGSNIGIFRRGRHGLDISLFSNASVPMTRRDQAATVLVTLAVVASRPVNLGSVVLVPYGGYEALVPVGHRARGVFTPVETQHTGIAGVAIPLHTAWAAYLECDPGPAVRSGGMGLVLTIPRRRSERQ